MIARLLSIFFPPRLPDRIENWESEPAAADQRTVEEQGCARLIPTPLTGVEKHWAEEDAQLKTELEELHRKVREYQENYPPMAL